MSENPQRSGVERAAILLMTLGEQDAASVLKQLDPKEVQRVGAAMAQLAAVSRQEVSAVLDQFSGELGQQSNVGLDSNNYLRKVLNEALGEDKANSVVDRILGKRSSSGLEALKWMEAKSVAEMLRFEHPQIIATVLSYLDSDHSAEILNGLQETTRADVITRIATLDGVHPSALSELDQVLERQFSGSNATKSSGFGGPKVAADILNLVGAASEGKIIEAITQVDEQLAQKLQDLMFVFTDLVSIDDRGMQELLREVPGDKLVLALKGADEDVKQKFFKNMSERAAGMLKDDLESKGPVKLSEVEGAQKEILLSARKLAEEGRIQLGGKGGEEYV
ncbi:MAG: flagellar motor switch protein FliG [Steroidobacteraceae bacterium]